MKELKTEIIINASQETVWQVLTNFEQYASWNPFIVNSSGKAVAGERITNQMKQGEKTFTFKPKLIEVQSYQKLEWMGHLMVPGLFDGHHYFHLEKTGIDQTKLIHGEKFSGLFRTLIMKNLEESTRDGFVRMNRALKERAEQIKQSMATGIVGSHHE